MILAYGSEWIEAKQRRKKVWDAKKEEEKKDFIIKSGRILKYSLWDSW